MIFCAVFLYKGSIVQTAYKPVCKQFALCYVEHKENSFEV